MSDSSHLVPNLYEMMEEYAEGKEEAVQETQSEAVQEGEISEARIETEQPTEETRKRKRGVEQRKEKASNFVSERPYFSWR